MLHRSLEVLDLENHVELAEAATALDAIFTDSASVSMANAEDEQLPNTLKESLASIEVEVEHAANLEHSKSGCLAVVCEKLQGAAVEGVPARGDVYQQFRRALQDESLKGEYEQCKSKQAKDLFRKEWTPKRVKVLQSRLVQTKVLSVTDFSKGTYRSLARTAVEEGNDTEAAASVWSWVLHFQVEQVFDAIQVFALRGGL